MSGKKVKNQTRAETKKLKASRKASASRERSILNSFQDRLPEPESFSMPSVSINQNNNYDQVLMEFVPQAFQSIRNNSRLFNNFGYRDLLHFIDLFTERDGEASLLNKLDNPAITKDMKHTSEEYLNNKLLTFFTDIQTNAIKESFETIEMGTIWAGNPRESLARLSLYDPFTSDYSVYPNFWHGFHIGCMDPEDQYNACFLVKEETNAKHTILSMTGVSFSKHYAQLTAQCFKDQKTGVILEFGPITRTDLCEDNKLPSTGYPSYLLPTLQIMHGYIHGHAHARELCACEIGEYLIES